MENIFMADGHGPGAMKHESAPFPRERGGFLVPPLCCFFPNNKTTLQPFSKCCPIPVSTRRLSEADAFTRMPYTAAVGSLFLSPRYLQRARVPVDSRPGMPTQSRLQLEASAITWKECPSFASARRKQGQWSIGASLRQVLLLHQQHFLSNL